MRQTTVFMRVLMTAVVVGGVAFAAGFFGPIIFTPEANQGPLLGIFITGPLGFVFGMGIGVWREARRASREKNVVKEPRAPSRD
jgi:hypothetical protein